MAWRGSKPDNSSYSQEKAEILKDITNYSRRVRREKQSHMARNSRAHGIQVSGSSVVVASQSCVTLQPVITPHVDHHDFSLSFPIKTSSLLARSAFR